ncbi:MAG: beta-ketoacyl-ACP synthase III [Aquihabitans sp.]
MTVTNPTNISTVDTVGRADLSRTTPVFGLRMLGLGSSVPDTRVTNADLAERLDTDDQWIRDRTGIHARRVAAIGESTLTLAAEAGQRAIADAGLTAADIDLVVVATATPVSPCPSTASRVVATLGLACGGFDLNGACTGFVHALHTAAALLVDPSLATILVIGADRFTTLVDPDDRSTAVLFGDGAGAVVVGATAAEAGGSGILGTDVGGDHTGVGVLEVPPGDPWVAMDGPELFRRATRGLVASANRALDRAGATGSDVDLYVPHQANARIIAATADRLGLDPATVVYDLAERANTSAASIPLALDAAHQAGRLQPGMRVLISGIGAGLGWSSLYLRWGA